MPTFHPGNIVIDKNSQFGLVHLPPAQPLPDWPDLNLWETSIERGLGLIAGNRIVGVGNTVLRNVEHRPDGNTAVYIVPAPGRDIAKTDGIISPGGINTTGTPAIFVTCSFRDAYQESLLTGVWGNPPGVLSHELVHVLMTIHRLNEPAAFPSRSRSRWRGRGGMRAYPSFNEFCATTIQNMMLSEHGAQLADGYSYGADDPDIISARLVTQNPGPFGLQADNLLTDTAAFVARNRPPLFFLWNNNNLRRFTRSLANNRRATFNPFRELRNQLRASGRSGRINPGTRARKPGPLRKIPRRRPIRIP
jgi:hypothetical protein